MSHHPTDGIAELVSQIVEDLFNGLVRDADALKWSPAQRKLFRRWIANEASCYLEDPHHPGRIGLGYREVPSSNEDGKFEDEFVEA